MSKPALWVAGAVTLLAAPACIPPRVEYRTVEVAVPVPCPEPPYIQYPELPIAKLTKDSTPDEIARAYVLSVEILRQQLWTALRLLDTYRRPSGPKL